MSRNTPQGFMGEAFAEVHKGYRPLPIGLRGNVTGHYFVRLFGAEGVVNPDAKGMPRPSFPKSVAAAVKLLRPAFVKLVKAVEKRAEEQKAKLAESKKKPAAGGKPKNKPGG